MAPFHLGDPSLPVLTGLSFPHGFQQAHHGGGGLELLSTLGSLGVLREGGALELSEVGLQFCGDEGGLELEQVQL